MAHRLGRAAVVLVGLPLGLVWYSIPDWMRSIGVDIRVVGLFTLAQAPWAFKVLWSPLMDRYVPPFWGRRRGWMAVTQVALAVLGLLLAGVGRHPDAIWVVGALALAIALASASQDIAIDAYAVEVLRKDEQGAAVGARIALYRAAMVVSGGGGDHRWRGASGWPAVNVLLALVYLPMLAPHVEGAGARGADAGAARRLRDAVWQPFLGFLARHRALEILAFVLLYKFADQLTQALTRPFLIDMGYNADHRGIALATVGHGRDDRRRVRRRLGHDAHRASGTRCGSSAFLQIFSNLGYYFVSLAGGPEPAADVRRDGLRAVHLGPRHRARSRCCCCA